jgi:uncharacterized alpha-E superfamily protein
LLARTAENLFWLARYVERADFTARIIDVTSRLAALPQSYRGVGGEWESALAAVGGLNAFNASFSEPTESNVVHFLAFDETNPSSIHNCLEQARTNARTIRTALTAEMWQAINSGWLELKSFEERRRTGEYSGIESILPFLEFVKSVSLDFDGAAYRTMLRNDAYWFNRVGLYVERADNTARLMDVKYNVLLPKSEAVGGSLDYFQWTSILRAVSAQTAYHWVYRESVKPWLIADLLILRKEMPRSLIYCYDNLARFLDHLGKAYGMQATSQRHTRMVLRRLENTSMEEIFQEGLHEFVTKFIDDNDRLGGIIAEQYLLI